MAAVLVASAWACQSGPRGVFAEGTCEIPEISQEEDRLRVELAAQMSPDATERGFLWAPGSTRPVRDGFVPSPEGVSFTSAEWGDYGVVVNVWNVELIDPA